MGGDSEEGGGGSFHWKVSANNAATAGQSQNGNKVDHIGSDDPGEIKPGEKFTVSIKVPNGVLPGDFLNTLKGALTVDAIDSVRVYYILPLENDKTQVRVSWGNSPNNRGNSPTGP